MNREIKFRVWDCSQKKYLYDPHYVLYEGRVFEAKTPYDDNEPTWLGEELENVIIEQFTGLTDKNGVDIYEGDIIELEINGIIEKAVVDYDFFGSYPFSSKDSYDYDIWASAYAQNKVSVIGKVHENPEILNSNGE